MADKKIQLLIYKMIDGCKEDGVFIDGHGMEFIKAKWPSGIKVYIKKSTAQTPVWLNDFFDDYISKETKDMYQLSTVSCVAVVRIMKDLAKADEADKTESDVFCVCFGHGFQYINKGQIEKDFGLNLSRKIVNSDSIKSVDIRSFEAVPKRKSIHALKDSEFSGYLLDAAKDNIRQVVGLSKSDNPLLNDRVIGGSDAFKISTPVNISHITSFLRDIITIYDKEDDRLGYASMYNEVPVADVLDDILKSINSEDKLYLAVPSEIDSFDDMTITYINIPGMEDKVFSSLKISDIKEYLVSTEVLQKAMVRFTFHNIEGESEDICKTKDISLIACITGDFYLDARKKPASILDNVVYELSGKLTKYIEDVYNQTDLNSNLPDTSDYGNEDDYNKKVCEDTKFLHLDRVLHIVESNDKVELCDFMGPDKKLYCVKRKHDSSSLGHLFDQAVASASALVLDDVEKFNEKIRQQCELENKDSVVYELKNVKPSEYTYVFVILDDGKKHKDTRPDIPFMAKVSYSECYRRLTSFGFKVQVCGVNCIYSDARAAELKKESEEIKAKKAVEKEKKSKEEKKSKKAAKHGSGAIVVETAK